MNLDFVDFVAALLAAEARFLVVGARALAVHAVPVRPATSTCGSSEALGEDRHAG